MIKKLLNIFLSAAMMMSLVSCKNNDHPIVVPYTPEENISENEKSDNIFKSEYITTKQDQDTEDDVFKDNIWAAFLVNPSVPAYENSEQGYEILDVLCNDSVIGDVALLSKTAQAPPDTVAYNTKIITAGGPVPYSRLAYGKMSEVPNSFLTAMVSEMKSEIGDDFGEHSSGAGMGYRTFYQASYDVDTGTLQVNQTDGYWARTLGAFSEHCAGVAVDFDISYHSSEYLEKNGAQNREGGTSANTEFKWLADNAHRYGFIWRYKIDGSDESAKGFYTGTIREGWHWRFVGVYHATKFWEHCAVDTDNDGVQDTGYMTNDNYIWEDYFSENISGNSKFPQNEHEAFCRFYNSEEGKKCTYNEYLNLK